MTYRDSFFFALQPISSRLPKLTSASFQADASSAAWAVCIASSLFISSLWIPLISLAAEPQTSQIVWKTDQLDDVFFAEGATAGDIDGDGHADVVSGPYWFAGPEFKQRHTIYAPKPFDPHGYSDNFFSYVDDLNGDGNTDVLVIGFPGAAAYWYENPGTDVVRGESAVWKKHLVIDIVDNESPTYADITGDGKREIICSRDGFFGYARPIEGQPTKPWQFTAISDKSAGGRFTHGLGVGDIDGDGRIDLLEKTGW